MFKPSSVKFSAIANFAQVDFSMVTSAENEPFEMSDGKMAALNGQREI